MFATAGLKRGYGSCPNCFRIYSNRSKPLSCDCGHLLGGKHVKRERAIPVVDGSIKVYEGHDIGTLISFKLSQAGDRAFGFVSDGERICFVQKCLELRSAFVNSKDVENFSCPHLVRETLTNPMLVIEKFNNEEIDENIQEKDISIEVKKLQFQNEKTPVVVKLTEKSYAVKGYATPSSPMGYFHVVQHNTSNNVTWKCTGDDCNVKLDGTKQVNRKKLCLHKQLVILCRKLKEEVQDTENSARNNKQAPLDSNTSNLKRTSTIKLHLQRSLPYSFDPSILCQSDNIAASYDLLCFDVVSKSCELCGSSLSESMFPQGCRNKEIGNGILITNKHPFRRIIIKVKKCLNTDCYAINTVFPIHQGLYNICNKVLVALDILLEYREFFKNGFPLTNIITSKLESLRLKCMKESGPTDNEIEYLKDLLYDGFYSFEAITERDLDNVICGICGVLGKVYYGDGNEKNCCKITEPLNFRQLCLDKKHFKFAEVKEKMYHAWKFASAITSRHRKLINLVNSRSESSQMKSSQHENEASMELTLYKIKERFVEKAVFTGVKNNFKIDIDDVPPLIPNAIRSSELNTESKKNSIYLKKSNSKDFQGDPILLSQLLAEKKINSFETLSEEEIKLLAEQSGIKIGSKSNDMIKHDLHMLMESVLIGSSLCHGFTKVPGHTGGFYHIVCPHGTTVCSKFMILTESVRDPADLWLSMKYPPVMFICDTPCTFVRHINLRKPSVSQKVWGERNGCFEKPQLGRSPKKSMNVPSIVPHEYSSINVLTHSQDTDKEDNCFMHPLTGSADRYVCGDRFHSKVNPHKSPLCSYHDIDLCSQANTLKTSYQESMNHKKNLRRNRSSCNQSFMVHIFYNYLMNFYENEEIIQKQKKFIEKSTGVPVVRDGFYRFVMNTEE